MVIVINSVIGGFSCPITLSAYNCAEWLEKYKAADVPVTFEEVLMVMINNRNRFW